jgi:signal transduction histidine kinase
MANLPHGDSRNTDDIDEDAANRMHLCGIEDRNPRAITIEFAKMPSPSIATSGDAAAPLKGFRPHSYERIITGSLRAWIALAFACSWLAAISALGQTSAPAEITTFHQFYSMTPEQASNGAPVRIEGVILCYDLGWKQLYIYDGAQTAWQSPQLFQTNLQAGLRLEISGSTTLAQGGVALTNLHLKVLGHGAIPEAKRLELSQLGGDFGQWIEIRGRVRVAETSPGRLSLVVQSKGQTCLVYVMGMPGNSDYRWLLGCHVRIRGINASKSAGGLLQSAAVFSPGLNEIEVTERATTNPRDLPVTSIDTLLNLELGSWTNDPVRIDGLITSYKPGALLVLKDVTGSIRTKVIQTTDAQVNEHVDVWGYLDNASGETVLKDAYFEIQHPIAPTAPPRPAEPVVGQLTNSHPELTLISKISKLRPEEASQGWPVRLQGTVTYSDPDWHNCYIQNKNGAIYVEQDQRDVAVGQWVEVTGQTSPGGFAPEVINSHFRTLGTTNLPVPVRADLEDLANGHLDSHWVQLDGVVRNVTEQWGHVTLSLTTPKGRFKAIVLKSNDQSLPTNLVDSLVSIHGACTSEMNGHSQLTGISLRVPSFDQIATLEPVPANPFAVPSVPIRSVAVFDPTRLAGRRVRICGKVILNLTGQGLYVQDDSGGIRIKTTQTNDLHAGDSVSVLGFPAMGDFSPYLEEATFQRSSSTSSPQPALATAEEVLLRGTNDAALVQIEARLVQSVPRSAHPKLVLQSGSIIFTAQLVDPPGASKRPEFQTGSLLRLTGVCVIQSGEGHQAESFRLLLSKPEDIVLLSTPPWWTIQHAIILAGSLLLAVLLAWGWSSSLRRQVRLQTEVIRRNEQELISISRKAGMAEVATSVLHNVGNVLNSVNVSATLASDELRDSKAPNVSLVAAMMNEHASDLGEFITKDAKGSRLPKYLAKLGEHLVEEQHSIQGELQALITNIQHIKDIVQTQQCYAKFGGVIETVRVSDLIEDSVRMNLGALERHEIRLLKDFDAARSPEITVEKHKVLQILINLVSNAKHACAESGQAEKRLTIRVTKRDDGVRIDFADNGVGIRAENLTRIFAHGFTTRKNGHGFGLHSSALAAQEMGGSLIAHSDGPGQGATFTLELPRSSKHL